jgi:hypothetical protein
LAIFYFSPFISSLGFTSSVLASLPMGFEGGPLRSRSQASTPSTV